MGIKFRDVLAGGGIFFLGYHAKKFVYDALFGTRGMREKPILTVLLGGGKANFRAISWPRYRKVTILMVETGKVSLMFEGITNEIGLLGGEFKIDARWEKGPQDGQDIHFIAKEDVLDMSVTAWRKFNNYFEPY